MWVGCVSGKLARIAVVAWGSRSVSTLRDTSVAMNALADHETSALTMAIYGR